MVLVEVTKLRIYARKKNNQIVTFESKTALECFAGKTGTINELLDKLGLVRVKAREYRFVRAYK